MIVNTIWGGKRHKNLGEIISSDSTLRLLLPPLTSPPPIITRGKYTKIGLWYSVRSPTSLGSGFVSLDLVYNFCEDKQRVVVRVLLQPVPHVPNFFLYWTLKRLLILNDGPIIRQKEGGELPLVFHLNWYSSHCVKNYIAHTKPDISE